MERHQHLGYLVSGVVLMHVLLISAQVSARPGATVLQTVTFGLFAEAQRWVTSVRDRATGVWSSYAGLRDLHTENVALQEDLARLRVELQQQRALAQQVRGLERLLALRETVELRTLSARVIASDATPYFRTLTIDRGGVDGVHGNLAVIAPEGVVGRVMDVQGRRAAQVQLLVDRNAAAGALIERTRASGVVVGTDDIQSLRMDYVSNLEDVLVGDRIVTSGMDGIYPKGLPVGRVTHVAQGIGLYRVIEVAPMVEFTQLEEVLVVLGPGQPPGRAGDE